MFLYLNRKRCHLGPHCDNNSIKCYRYDYNRGVGFPKYFLFPERWSGSQKFIGTQKLSEMILQPYDLFKAGWADTYILGMLNQVAQAMDDGVTSQV